jgi:hypothetical protein
MWQRKSTPLTVKLKEKKKKEEGQRSNILSISLNSTSPVFGRQPLAHSLKVSTQ